MTAEKPRSVYIVAVIAVVLIALLPFLPLVAALFEDQVFGTCRVEDFCKHLGVHDELATLYKTFGLGQ